MRISQTPLKRIVLVAFPSLLTFVLAVACWVFRPLARIARRAAIRSVWTGAPVINMAVNCRAERRLGVQSLSIVLRTYFLTSEFDVVLGNVLPYKWWLRVSPYLAFVWICLTADRVHAYCDGGILPQIRISAFNPFEMQAYRLLRIPIFLWTYGADVRARGKTMVLGEPNCCTDCNQIGRACVCDDAVWRRNFAYLRSNAKAIFAMGDMIEYTPGSINDLFFWPIDFDRDGGERYRPVFPTVSPGRPLRVVHAPNHRQFKGTVYLEQAVAALQAEGIAIELVLVEGVANDKALEIYRTADVIFDQCLVGFHGYFAIEAMALGKPVICFIRDMERYLIEPHECPIINVRRDELLHVLKMLSTTGRGDISEIGHRSRAYVEKHFSIEAFAERLKTSYEKLGVVQ